MRYITFLKEKWYIIIWLLFWLFTVNVFLMTFRDSLWLGIYIDVTALVSFLLLSFMEYYKSKKYFNELKQLADNLDKKYLLPEIMSKGHDQAEKEIYWLIKDMGKAMTEHVNSYKYSSREYKEYIEMWIHEVKIPIATAKLVLANHKSDYTESVEEELQKIENFTEQALFYARSSYVEKDYLISNISLQEIVHGVLLRNKRSLILCHTQMNLHDLDKSVLSDGKWLGFIISQILSNSLKYASGDTLSIEIYAVSNETCVELHMKDNGIGISPKELPLVFDKGFTGNNGRGNVKSTGIGLYLCKKLCNRLGHSISVLSNEGSGCEVIIGFSKTSFYDTLS